MLNSISSYDWSGYNLLITTSRNGAEYRSWLARNVSQEEAFETIAEANPSRAFHIMSVVEVSDEVADLIEERIPVVGNCTVIGG